MRDHDATVEVVNVAASRLRDATEAEIADEPSCVLEALADGSVRATWTTRALAIEELNRRGIPTNTIEKALA